MGYNEKQGKFTLTLDKQPFEKLPEFKDVGEVPKLAHSDIQEHYGTSVERIDFNPFLKGVRTPVSVELNKRSRFLTVDIAGKPQMSKQVEDLLEAFEDW